MKKLLLLPVLILALTACTGNVSFNEEEIQEIAKSQSEGGLDWMFKLDKAEEAGMKEPVRIERYKTSELNDEARSMILQSGYKLIHSGEYEEFKLNHNAMISMDPYDISAIEILNEITPEIRERYGKGSENGVVIITIKDEATREIPLKNR